MPVRILVAPADIDAATPNPPTLAVTCVATGMPHPHITWQRNGHLVTNQFIQEEVVIRNGLEVVVGTLLICPLRPEWGGEYTCQARNQHSLAEASFTVATTGEATCILQCVHLRLVLPVYSCCSRVHI